MEIKNGVFRLVKWFIAKKILLGSDVGIPTKYGVGKWL